MNLLNIRTWADARAFVHTASPVIFGLLVTQGALSHDEATLWAALVVALISPALALWNTVEGFRKWLYPVLGAASALVVAYGLATVDTINLWVPIVALIFGGSASAIATANTNTSPSTERAGQRRAA